MAITSNTVTLIVNQLVYAGWQTVRITRSLDAVAGSFELGLTDVWEPGQEPWPIVKGSACLVAIGSEVVITGWVDEVTSLFDGTPAHTLTVKGRDKTCDIVDCSAVNSPGEWHRKKIESIAADICLPYGVKVVSNVDTGPPIKLFRLQPGEKCMDALERLCKGGGVMLILTGNAAGDVVITSASTEQVAPSNGGVSLQEGVNLQSISHKIDATEQFSTYIVKAYAADDDDVGAVSLNRFNAA